MEFFSGDVQVVISVVSGLLGGAVGGVATAGAIAVRGAKAQDRYRATAAVRGVLNPTGHCSCMTMMRPIVSTIIPRDTQVTRASWT